MRKIQAVIFDFGRVVCSFDTGLFLHRASNHSTLSLAQVTAIVPSLVHTANRYETGLLTSDEFYREVCTMASLTMTREEFLGAYTDIFTPIPTTFALVKKLKPRYRLGLLSNTSEWHFEYGIRKVEIFPLFDTVSLSYVVGSMKPDRAIYDDALAKLGLPPDVCAYIDDIQENVDAGRSLGLHAIRYSTYDALLADLSRLGIEI